jgi:phage terminase large subunit-like protein
LAIFIGGGASGLMSQRRGFVILTFRSIELIVLRFEIAKKPEKANSEK